MHPAQHLTGLPTQPDPIPDFARDLELVADDDGEEEPDITWYMDRNPSTVSEMTVGVMNLINNLNMTPSPVVSGSRVAMMVEGEEERDITTFPSPVVSGVRFLEFEEPEPSHHINLVRLRQLTGGDQISARQIYDSSSPFEVNIVMNLINHFDAASGNIPFAPQVKKYNITPVLEIVLNKIEDEDEDCAICYESIKCMDFVKLNCEHKFCGSCIQETLKSHNKLCGPRCALCRTKMVSFSVKNSEIYNSLLEHCL
jgi:hypothetical protein